MSIAPNTVQAPASVPASVQPVSNISIEGEPSGQVQDFALDSLPKLGEGAEGAVYVLPKERSGRPKDLVFKVLADPSDTKTSKLAILAALAESQPEVLEYLALPQLVVYDSYDGSVAGYTMPRVEGVSIDRVIRQILAHKQPNYGKVLDLIRRLDLVIRYTHGLSDGKGTPLRIVIGDFNLQNFIVDSANNVRLIDTDGFGIGNTYPVSCRGGVKPCDKVNNRVTTGNDYFQLYWQLCDLLSPEGVQATYHRQFKKKQLRAKKISIFHPEAMNSPRTRTFVEHLPEAVRQDFVNVFVHDQRHPLKRATLAALREYYDCPLREAPVPAASRAAILQPKSKTKAQDNSSAKPLPVTPPKQTPKPYIIGDPANYLNLGADVRAYLERRRAAEAAAKSVVKPAPQAKNYEYFNLETLKQLDCELLYDTSSNHETNVDYCLLSIAVVGKPGYFRLCAGYLEGEIFRCLPLRIAQYQQVTDFEAQEYDVRTHSLKFKFNGRQCKINFKSERFSASLETNAKKPVIRRGC